VIAEHPDILEADLLPPRSAITPVINGQRSSSFLTADDERGPFELEQPVRIAGLGPESGDDADHRDMRRLVAGQEEALQSLMERHAETLYSQLARILRNRAEAQDSLQETFVRIYRHRGRFDFDRKFSTWLYAIAFNLARDQLRRRARRPEFISLDDPVERDDLAEELLDPEQPPDEQLDKEERFRALAEAMDALPEGLRQPLILFAFDEKSQPEIAAEMHCTAKAVEMRLYHARKMLHDRLKKEFERARGILCVAS
jgi:RNA polymerase sigma-70 factor (ECF subfamily)